MRLTAKYNDNHYYSNIIPPFPSFGEKPSNTQQLLKDKLGQLEDIEDELGIDLITLFKALKNGCFAKETFDYMGKTQTQIIFTEFTYLYYTDDIGAYFIHIRTKDHYLKDYGKTWALTKEELK